jgi:adenosylhomocysteine nucleosidase
MTGLVMATPMEAAPLLALAGLAEAPAAPLPLFLDLRPARNVVLCLCGMGPANAQAGMVQLLQRYAVARVINAGVAGALADHLDVAGVYRVARTFRWPAHSPAYDCQPDVWAHLAPVVLATVDEPVFDPVRRATMAPHAEIVDMEGAVIAQLCQAHGVPFSALKGITDQAGAADRPRLLRNLARVSAAVAAQLWPGLA